MSILGRLSKVFKLEKIKAPGQTNCEALKSLFCIVIRHDLDCMNEEDIRNMYALEKELGFKSTSFAFYQQIRDFHALFREMIDSGWDIQLHTQSRPYLLVNHVGIVEYMYRKNLKNEFTRASKILPVTGHAEHGIHNYLNFFDCWNCDIIENATIDSGFNWISDYRLIVQAIPGREFPQPIPPYKRTYTKTGKSIVVFTTSWEDRYMMPSDDDITFRNQNKIPFRSLDETFTSIKNSLNICSTQKIPFVISLHPNNWIRGNLPSVELEKFLSEYSKKEDVPILTLKDIYKEINHAT